MFNDSIRANLNQSTTMVSAENTPEERRLATRAICGARACRGSKDAAVVLEALGLLDQTNHG